MRVTADSYRLAAAEHSVAAQELWRAQRFPLAQYTAGLAVECILLAYSSRAEAEFDARHNLYSWFGKSQISKSISEDDLEIVSEALTIVSAHWSNDQRYYSPGLLRAHFKKAALDRGIKGDIVKELTRQTVNAAIVIVDIGVSRWNRLSTR